MNEVIVNIYNRIMELSDLGVQRKLWLNENNDTGLISSYYELVNSLFDDFNFDIFIDNTAAQNGLSNSSIFELSKLRELLNNYNKMSSDEEIINDPEWKEIVEQAKLVINEWNKDC